MYCIKSLLRAVKNREMTLDGDIQNGHEDKYLEIKEFIISDLEGNTVDSILEGQSVVVTANASFKAKRTVHIEYNPLFYTTGLVSAGIIVSPSSLMHSPELRLEALKDLDINQLTYFCRLHLCE